jgi:hypothetical protein
MEDCHESYLQLGEALLQGRICLQGHFPQLHNLCRALL